MDRDTALTRLQGIEADIAALHAEQARLLVLVASSAPVVEELLVLDPRPGHDDERVIRIEDAAREEIAAALRWSTAAAHARIDQARLLAGPLGGDGGGTGRWRDLVGPRRRHRGRRPPPRSPMVVLAGGACCVHRCVRAPAAAGAPDRPPRHPLDDAAGGQPGGDRRRRRGRVPAPEGGPLHAGRLPDRRARRHQHHRRAPGDGAGARSDGQGAGRGAAAGDAWLRGRASRGRPGVVGPAGRRAARAP